MGTERCTSYGHFLFLLFKIVFTAKKEYLTNYIDLMEKSN
jgi:hypothetical protein